MPTSEKRRRSKPTDDVVIPDKLYFRIGEASRLCKLPAYVLRFWETEFPQLKPVKSSTGQRMYRRADIEYALKIKRLLYDEGFTIAGARQHMRDEQKKGKSQPALFAAAAAAGANGNGRELKQLRAGLQEILHMLEKKKR